MINSLTIFLILGLATFRVTRMITTDVIFDKLRNKIWNKFPPNKGIGYLITCNWCLSVYVAILMSLFMFTLPLIALVVSLVLAISAIVGLLSALIDR